MPAHRLIANLKSQWVRLVLGWCAPEIIGDIYRGLLNRMPTSAEAAAWGADLRLHRDLARVLKPILDSGEFQQRMFVSRAPESVKAAYRAVLGREPDPEGESAHTSFLVKTRDFPALLSAMRDSAEFKQRELARLAPDFVDAACEGLLGRPADPAELATDITSLTAEDDLAPFLRRLVHSPELQRKVVASHLPERARADFLTWPEPESDPGDDDFLDTPATPRVIGEAVSLILGRPPAEADIEAQPPGTTVLELRKTLLRSDEFQRELAKPSAIPPPSTEEIDAMKTIFLHIPKAGGITMRSLLMPHFEPRHIFPGRFDGLHCYDAGDLARYRLFAGHFSLKSCELIPGPKRIFTILRHPVDRLISQYNFARAHSDGIIRREVIPMAKLARQYGMTEFFALEELRRFQSIDNLMVRMLSTVRAYKLGPGEEGFIAMNALETAKKNLKSMLTFGILERFEESVELIFSALGLPLPARIDRKNALADIAGKMKGLDVREHEACTPETLEAMAPLVEADMELYNYGLNLFEKNISALKEIKIEKE